MNKSHLTPTTIVDKNNKTTTVYTKPANSSTGKPALPAPTALAVPNMAQQIDEVVTHIAGVMDFDDEEQYDNTRKTVETYPADLITELSTKIKAGELGFIPSSLIGSGGDAGKVRDGLYFVHFLQTDRADIASHLIEPLHHYPQLPEWDHYHDADETTRKNCIALIQVTEMLDSEFDLNSTLDTGIEYDRSGVYLNEPKLVDLIMQHPDKAREIADLLIERRIGSLDVIAEIINDSNPALAEGKL